MVVRLSALRTGRLYHQETHLVLISVKRLSRPQGHNATGRIMSLKNSACCNEPYYINKQQIHFHVCDVFYSQCSHQHVSAGIPAMFRVKLLQEYESSNVLSCVAVTCWWENGE